MYGEKVVTEYGRQTGRRNDVIGEVTTSPSGNLIIRTGQLLEEGGWERVGHIVLTPAEAEELVNEISANMEGAS